MLAFRTIRFCSVLACLSVWALNESLTIKKKKQTEKPFWFLEGFLEKKFFNRILNIEINKYFYTKM